MPASKSPPKPPPKPLTVAPQTDVSAALPAGPRPAPAEPVQAIPDRADIKALATASARLAGHDLLRRHQRLVAELPGLLPDAQVQWSAGFELRTGADGQPQPWLHLGLQASLPQTCQRCLTDYLHEVDVAYDFRFVATEKEAEEADDESEEDLLVLNKQFNLAELVEDELLMAIPLIALHETCPQPVKMSVQDADFEAASAPKTKPFEGLSGLLKNPIERPGKG